MLEKIKEPILMANQDGALNCDTFAQKEFEKLQKKHNLKVAIETGTCLGYTTEFLSKIYEEVRTVEIVEDYLTIATTNRLDDCSNVKCYLGSSNKFMPKLLRGLGNDTFIFLDSHWQDYCPLKEELQAIADSGIEPVIAIHDFFVPNNDNLGYDSYNGQPFTFEWLKEDINAIYGEDNYNYYYNNESTGAERGIIYITPKK